MRLVVPTSAGELILAVSDSLYSQCVYVRQWGLLVDLGDLVLPDMAGVRRALLTHAHLDHVLHGCAKLALHARKVGRTVPVWCSSEDAPRLRELFTFLAAFDRNVDLFARLEVRAADEVAVRAGLVARAFPTKHCVPSRGWTVWRRRSRLAPSLRGLPPQEVGRRARAGERVSEEGEEPLATFTGDTTLAGLPDHAYASEVLVTECAMPERGEALERFGHMCPEDIREVLARFLGRRVVLVHTSYRTREELAKVQDERLVVVGASAP